MQTHHKQSVRENKRKGAGKGTRLGNAEGGNGERKVVGRVEILNQVVGHGGFTEKRSLRQDLTEMWAAGKQVSEGGAWRQGEQLVSKDQAGPYLVCCRDCKEPEWGLQWQERSKIRGFVSPLASHPRPWPIGCVQLLL